MKYFWTVYFTTVVIWLGIALWFHFEHNLEVGAPIALIIGMFGVVFTLGLYD